MWPSSEQTDGQEQQRQSIRWLRPLAVVGLVAILIAAPVAAVTGGAGSAPVADEPAQAQQETPTRTPHVVESASGSGSASASSETVVVGGSDHRQIDDDPDPRSIEVGETTGGEIDEDDPESSEYRGHHDPISFDGEAGQAVTIEMNARDRFYHPRRSHEQRGTMEDETDGMADPYLILVGPDGDVVARNDDTDNSLNARIQGLVLPEDGEYTIVATSFNESGTFEYTLSLSEEEEDGAGMNLRSIDLNSTATGEIDKADPSSNDRRGFYEPVTFEGEAGQDVRIDMGSRPGDTYLILLDPSGNVIAENDDYRSLNSSIQRVTLPEDGEYTVVATSFSRDDRFVYELSVEVIGSGNPDAGGENLRDIRIGESASGQIDTSDPQAGFLRGFYEPVTFEGRAGQSVTIDMESREGDTYLMLYGPDGDRIAFNDDFEGLNSRIETTLPDNGEYTIIATSFSDDDTFSYDLSVSEGGDGGPVNATDLRSISYGETAEGEIDEQDPESNIYRGYYEPVTFEGSAGDDARIEMTSRDDTYLILLAPNGTVVGENDDYRGLDSRIDAELPTDGQYTIIATSFSRRATFEYELSLER